MKSFQSISAVLLVTVLFASCGGGSPKTETATTDTSGSAVANTGSVSDDHQKLEANKQIATGFIQALYGDRDSTSIDKYVADNIIQHDPILEDGKEWLKKVTAQLLSNPNLEKRKIDIKKVAAEGDMVWTLIREVAPNGKVFARVEIFRIENQKIAERWLISQQEPKTSSNKN